MEQIKYILRDDVRIFFNSEDEIRFRKGIWNYVEAVINLYGQTDRVKSIFQHIINEFQTNNSLFLAKIDKALNLSKEEISDVTEILENISYQGFFVSEKESEASQIMAAIFGSSVDSFMSEHVYAKPVLFFTDNDISRDLAISLAEQISMPLDVMDKSLFDEIYNADLTSKTDAMKQIKLIEKFKLELAPYACILGNLGSLNISFLRNLNRVLIEANKPLIASHIDGPFMSIYSTNPPETGCFECFENRMIARMEDLTAYHKFIKQSKAKSKTAYINNAKSFSPLVHMLTSFVISEGFLYSVNSISRLSGRVITIYLPVFEIQAQDLLRVPYCSACGFSAKSQINELYTSSKNIIDKMVTRLHVVENK